MPSKPTGRPRGRPAGVGNKPKTISEFVLAHVKSPITPPPRKPPRRPTGPWVHMTPEERSAYAREIGKRSPNRQIPGKPRDLTKSQWEAVQATARLDTKRIMQKMKEAGTLPDDPMAVEALEKVVTTLRESTSPKDIAALGRLVLDFTKAKPTTKIETTVKSAEDWLDEMTGGGA